MLRINQTQDLSNRMSKLFEFIAAKFEVQSNSAPILAGGSSNGYQLCDTPKQPSIVRRRRSRQSRSASAGASGNIRASWF
jgi:hypothetical protein